MRIFGTPTQDKQTKTITTTLTQACLLHVTADVQKYL